MKNARWKPLTYFETHFCPVCWEYCVSRQEFNKPFYQIVECGCRLTLEEICDIDLKVIADGDILVVWNEAGL